MRLRNFIVPILVTAGISFPTVAEASFCGVAGQSPQQIQSNAKADGFKRIGGNARYIAYSNARTMVTLTFTTSANKAHPAVACRRVVQKGGNVKVLTEIRCGGNQSACKTMLGEFRVLDAQMKRAMEKSKSKP